MKIYNGLMLLIIFFVSMSSLTAEEFDKRIHDTLVKTIKKKVSAKAWKSIEKFGPRSESPTVVSHLIDRALENISALDPHVFTASWKVLRGYRSAESHKAIVNKIKSIKKDEHAVLPLSLLDWQINSLDEAEQENYEKTILPYLRSSYWPCRLAAVKACRAFESQRLGNALVGRLTGKETRNRIKREIKLTLRDVYKKAPKEDVSAEQWVSWWVERSENKNEKVSKEMVKFAATAEVGNYSGQSQPIDKIEYFNHKIHSDNFVLVTDYSNSMGAQVTIDSKFKNLQKSYFKGDLESLAIERKIYDVKTKHEFVVRKQIELISLMPHDRNFNLVYFGGNVSHFKSPKNLIQATVKNKKSAIKYLTSQGLTLGTQIYEGIVKGLESPEVDAMYLLTDGKPYHSKVMDPDAVGRACIRWAVMRQIVFNTIDLGLIPATAKGAKKKAKNLLGMSKKHGVQKLQANDFLKYVSEYSGGTYQLYKDLKNQTFWIPEGIKQ